MNLLKTVFFYPKIWRALTRNAAAKVSGSIILLQCSESLSAFLRNVFCAPSNELWANAFSKLFAAVFFLAL